MKNRKLRVGPYTYDVCFVPDREKMDGSVGLTKPDQQLVYVWTGAHPDQVRDTLLHEVLHVVFETFSISGDSEESFVRPMATGLLHVMKANPWLVDMILE